MFSSALQLCHAVAAAGGIFFLGKRTTAVVRREDTPLEGTAVPSKPASSLTLWGSSVRFDLRSSCFMYMQPQGPLKSHRLAVITRQSVVDVRQGVGVPVPRSRRNDGPTIAQQSIKASSLKLHQAGSLWLDEASSWQLLAIAERC